MNNAVKFYQELNQNHGADPDYEALNQGQVKTAERHEKALSFTFSSKTTPSVLDVGCGTGLILEGLVAKDVRPSLYRGVDLLEERRAHVQARLDKYGIHGGYECTDPSKSFRDQFREFGSFDAGLAIGIAGFAGCHTHGLLMDLVSALYYRCKNGFVTFPYYYDQAVLGHDHLCRFDVSDVQSRVKLMNLDRVQIGTMEREAFLWW